MAKNKISDFYLSLGVNFDDKAVKKFVKDLSKVDKALDGITEKSEDLAKTNEKTARKTATSYKKLFSLTKKLTFSVASLGGAFVFAGKKVTNNLISLDNLAEQTGASKEEIELLRRKIEQVGGAAGEADKFVASFSDKIAELRLRGGEAGLFMTQIFGDSASLDDPIQAMQELRRFFLQANQDQRRLAASEFGLSPEFVSLLTATADEYERISKTAKDTALFDDKYIRQARDFQREFASIQTEFRRLSYDIFLESADAIRDAIKQIRAFLRDEDIKSLIVKTVQKISDLFEQLINGLGFVLERVSEAVTLAEQGKNFQAARTLFSGTAQQRKQAKQKKKEERRKRPGIIKSPLPAIKKFGDMLFNEKNMQNLAPSVSPINNANSTNNVNIINNFNKTTTTGEEVGTIKNQLKDTVANFTERRVN